MCSVGVLACLQFSVCFKQVPLNAKILNTAFHFLIQHIPYLSLYPTIRFTLYCSMVAGIQRMFIIQEYKVETESSKPL